MNDFIWCPFFFSREKLISYQTIGHNHDQKWKKSLLSVYYFFAYRSWTWFCVNDMLDKMRMTYYLRYTIKWRQRNCSWSGYKRTTHHLRHLNLISWIAEYFNIYEENSLSHLIEEIVSFHVWITFNQDIEKMVMSLRLHFVSMKNLHCNRI